MRFVVAVLWIVAACGDGTTPEKEESPPVCPLPTAGADVTAACEQLAAAQCERLATCSATRMSLTWPDLETCHARNTLSCMIELSFPSTGASTSSVTACAAALAGQECTAFLSGYQVPSVCSPAGSLPNGELCEYGSHCASSFCGLSFGPDKICMTAPNLPLVGADELCMQNSVYIGRCQYGFECLFAPMPGSSPLSRCRRLATSPGAACGALSGCSQDLGLICSVTPGVGGECVSFEPGVAGADCSHTPCSGASVCSVQDGSRCVLRVEDCGPCAKDTDCKYPARCRESMCGFPQP